MKIEPMPLSKLLGLQHPKNAKLHDHAEIADSIRRFGFRSPVMLDEETSTLVAGHGRCQTLQIMREAGEPAPKGIAVKKGEWQVPTILGASFASDAERDAYLLADNQLVIAGGWNTDALAEMLRELSATEEGLEGLGFADDYLDTLLADTTPDESGDPGTTTVKEHERLIHKIRPPVQMTNDDWTLHLGDCVEGMRKLADNSIDAVVTDPPAGISFMGRGWDDDKGGRDQWITWLQGVMVEALRVLKPGGHALVWALPRTSHWTATAIENAGFEVRDRVSHLFITGFPKSLDVSKAIDEKLGAEREVIGEQVAFNKLPLSDLNERDTAPLFGGPVTAAAAALQGWGTALKPAIEDWWLARKPLEGTVAETAIKYGTGGINIDACRIGDEERHNPSASSMYSMGETPMEDEGGRDAVGRWPPHLAVGRWPPHLAVGRGVEINEIDLPALYFYCPKPAKSETEAGLDALPLVTGAEVAGRSEGSAGMNSPRAGVAKGSRRNIHPTKKPIGLMRWLVRLIAPPHREGEPPPTILDMFAGSGTTGLAALVEGCRFIGFEQSAEYHAIACERLRSIIEDPRQADDADELPESDG